MTCPRLKVPRRPLKMYLRRMMKAYLRQRKVFLHRTTVYPRRLTAYLHRKAYLRRTKACYWMVTTAMWSSRTNLGRICRCLNPKYPTCHWALTISPLAKTTPTPRNRLLLPSTWPWQTG